MTELKPCPLCGSEAEVHREPQKGVQVSCFKPYIECGCGLTLQKNSFTELIEAWNRRPELNLIMSIPKGLHIPYHKGNAHVDAEGGTW